MVYIHSNVSVVLGESPAGVMLAVYVAESPLVTVSGPVKVRTSAGVYGVRGAALPPLDRVL